MEVHHFCGALDSGLIQCALFDGREPGGKLIGIEYVIGEELFKSLPEEEKKLWHSHVYKVKSGQPIAPNITDQKEYDLMKTLAATYGKIWHTRHTDHLEDKVSLGVPRVMMAFIKDGQADPAMVESRDRRFGISTGKKKKMPPEIDLPRVLQGADAWQTGDPPLLTDADGNQYILLTGEHEVPLMTPVRYQMLGGMVLVKGVMVNGKGIQAIYVDKMEKK